MPEPTPPALSPAEWQRRIVDRPPYAITLRGGVLQVHGVGTTITIPQELRAPISALCLDGQGFGFSRVDVEVLRLFARHGNPSHPARQHIAEIADRIASLLPPEPAP